MTDFLNFLLTLLSQFSGGPGPVENNLVRFGLAAILWAVLLYIAWSRQRAADLPREKLLVWGFGMALVRELYMFGQIAGRVISANPLEASCNVTEPIEHALVMVAVIVVAGAFLRYKLDDVSLTRRFLQVGLGIAGVSLLATALLWPPWLAASPGLKFHQTWLAWLFHLPLSLLILVAIYFLWQKPGWLRNVVTAALALYFLSEVLFLLNYSTGRTHAEVLCPLGNSFHILAIPLLGFVYLREQSLEKEQAEADLRKYRDHLEDLVKDRTVELTAVNARLHQEVSDRKQAEEALALMLQDTEQRALDLKRLQEISARLVASFDEEKITSLVSELSMQLMDCQMACVLRWDPRKNQLSLEISHGMSTDQKELISGCLTACDLFTGLVGSPGLIQINNAQVDPRIPPTWRERMSLQAFLCLPVWGVEQPLIYLCLFDTRRNRDWNPNEIELAESFSARAAVALMNASLHRHLEMAAALDERQRIAADMHDGLAQTLGLLGLRVDQAREQVAGGADQGLAAALATVREVVSQASSEVRRSIASLRDAPKPRASLQDQLRELSARQSSDEAMIQFVDHLPQPLFLAKDQYQQVLPLVQEALLNARNHAQAETIRVALEQSGDDVTLCIEDDGIGFDPNDLVKIGDHFGLSIMQARAGRIGGKLKIDSIRGSGTQVCLSWRPKYDQAPKDKFLTMNRLA